MPIQHIKPAAAKKLIDSNQGWTYVDVRTVEEYQANHATGACNIPFAVRDAMGRMTLNPEFAAVMKKCFAADAKLVLGCASGVRSLRACELLESQGFTSLANLQCGFMGSRDEMGQVVEPGWMGCGFPCESAAPKERTYAEMRTRK